MQDLVKVRDGNAVVSSLDVAEKFGKNHRDVLRAIDTMLSMEPSLTPAQFCAGVYTLPGTGSQQHRSYSMDRDGFALLAMGFTGKAALQWKLRFLEAFNVMERQLRETPADLASEVADLRRRVERLEATPKPLLPPPDDAYILRYLPKGKMVKRWALTRKVDGRINAATLDVVLDRLIRAQRVRAFTEAPGSGGGRPATYYVAV